MMGNAEEKAVDEADNSALSDGVVSEGVSSAGKVLGGGCINRADSVSDVIAPDAGLEQTASCNGPATDPASDALVSGTASRYGGNIDVVSDTLIEGWALVQDEPSYRIIIQLKEGERVLGHTVASNFRGDLKEAGLGDGSYGFQIPMPFSLLDGRVHVLSIVDQANNTRIFDEIEWRSTAGTSLSILKGEGKIGRGSNKNPSEGRGSSRLVAALSSGMRDASHIVLKDTDASVGMKVLFDVSDLIYYIGHHPNLTGIQRVQSSVVLAILLEGILPSSAVTFLSFNARTRRWAAIPQGFFMNLLQDLFLPEWQRSVIFSVEDARLGILPGAQDFNGLGFLDSGVPSVLCLLGAAWVQSDYFNRVLVLKREFGTRFVMLVHDLIPIYSAETCDQTTTKVFERFLRRAMHHVDHYLCVSKSTARDLRRYIRGAGLTDPIVTITRNGSSFNQFLTESGAERNVDCISDHFVLFVSTVEGRKNHKLVLDVWQRMLDEGIEPPQLVCVGRVGWRSDVFLSQLLECNYLDGRVLILEDISDQQLAMLYRDCLFSIYPSLYEGWGLPVGESLAAGKICVVSDRSSLPEVAGDFGVYVRIEDPDHVFHVICDLINNDADRLRREEIISRDYVPITWGEVASKVIEGCVAAVASNWTKPYPWSRAPYSMELCFGCFELDGISTITGPDMIRRIVDARRGILLMDPLRESSYLTAEDARSGGRWTSPEAWGTWLCDEVGDVVVDLEKNNCKYFYVALRLRVAPFLSDNGVSITANGEHAWSGAIGKAPKNILMRIRNRAGTADRGGKLHLRVAVEAEPAQLEKVVALDHRRPIVGFERIVIVPDNDINARLDLLTSIVV